MCSLLCFFSPEKHNFFQPCLSSTCHLRFAVGDCFKKFSSKEFAIQMFLYLSLSYLFFTVPHFLCSICGFFLNFYFTFCWYCNYCVTFLFLHISFRNSSGTFLLCLADLSHRRWFGNTNLVEVIPIQWSISFHLFIRS